jgi:hypothetical protein
MRLPAFLAFVLLWVGAASALGAVPFVAGEKLVFEASWGLLPAARMESEVFEVPGQPKVLRLVGRCVSVGAVEVLYPVRSVMESRITTVRGRPDRSLSLYEDRHEGWHRYHRYTYLDFRKGYGFWANYISGNVKRFKLKEPAWDVVALVFHARALEWKAGQSRKMALFSDGKYQSVLLRAEAPRTAGIGQWAPRPVLDLVSDDIMERAVKRKGRLRATVTQDERHLPLTVRLELSWGTVRLDLSEAKGVVGDPLPTTK